MREFMIGANDAGQRLDRFVSKAVPLLPAGLCQKYIRLKRIKVNGKRAKQDTRLQTGDTVQCYLNDEFFAEPDRNDSFLSQFHPALQIVYEDENLLLVNKRPGLVVHADETEKVQTLLHHIQAYLYQKGEWNPKEEHSFAPALCNRIDRNTGGIVMAAKNAETLRILNEKIRNRELQKFYLCVVLGRPNPAAGTIKGFLRKDESNNQVRWFSQPVPRGRTAVTRYQTLSSRNGLSLVECELVTGRTHQIRVSMAAQGHPLLGDGKYGNGELNRRYGETRQALCACRLVFSFTSDAGVLEYLRNRVFTVKEVPFLRKYFPDYSLSDDSPTKPNRT